MFEIVFEILPKLTSDDNFDLTHIIYCLDTNSFLNKICFTPKIRIGTNYNTQTNSKLKSTFNGHGKNEIYKFRSKRDLVI